jgi:hypothetical protein
MRAPVTLAAWCFSVLLLSACDKGPTLPRVEPTVPPVEPIKVEPGTTQSPACESHGATSRFLSWSPQTKPPRLTRQPVDPTAR